MDIKQRMVELANEIGRESLYPYVIGNLRAIFADRNYTDSEKVKEAGKTLLALAEVQNDKSLPWDREDAKKPSTGMESNEKINHPNNTIDLVKVESFCEGCKCNEL